MYIEPMVFVTSTHFRLLLLLVKSMMMIRNLNHLSLDMEDSKEHLLILKLAYLQEILVAKDV